MATPTPTATPAPTSTPSPTSTPTADAETPAVVLTHTDTFIVDSTVDAVDAIPGDGACDDGAGNCTLRAAIMEANSVAGASTITLPAGTYTLSIAGANEGAAETGDLDIIDDLTLSGAGADNTIVDGGALDRVFQVYSAPYVSFVPFPSVAISSMTVQNCAGSDGGGIYNEVGSTLAITNGTVSDNSADKGGAIYNAGTLTLPDSTGSGNTAGSEGGIYDKGKVDITNSTIAGDPP